MNSAFRILSVLATAGALIASSGSIRAQVSQADTGRPVQATAIVIVADIDSAAVYLDSVLIGYTPVSRDSVTPGRHGVRIESPDRTNWLATDIADSVTAIPGERTTYRFAFRKRFLISSVPSGATVLAGDSVLGTTPLLLDPEPTIGARTVTLEKTGYVRTSTSIDSARRGSLVVDLAHEWTPGIEPVSPFAGSSVLKTGPLRLYLSGAVAVVAGVSAAYFKVRADKRQDEYLLSNDPGLLAERKRYDTASAISLAVTQVGVALFTYFLLTE